MKHSDRELRALERAGASGNRDARLKWAIGQYRAGHFCLHDASAVAGYLEALSHDFGPFGFSFVGVNRYECAGLSNHVASFMHAGSGLVFHLLPGGTYLRGDERDEATRPVVPVTVQPFLLSRTPCTQEAWERVTGSNPSAYPGARRPVEQVSWSAIETTFSSATGLLLPSEAQWEFACRAGSTGPFCCLNDEAEVVRHAVCQRKEEGTLEVGERLPNAFGLHDMHGNVWEWCLDRYEEGYHNAPTDDRPHFVPRDRDWPERQTDQSIRGGCWRSSWQRCTSTQRLVAYSEDGRSVIGFRPCLSLRAMRGRSAQALAQQLEAP